MKDLKIENLSFPKYPEHSSRPIDLKIFKKKVQEAFDSCLIPLGFIKIKTFKWVRSQKPQIREVVALNSLRSAWAPAWGVSLDFVPHVSGKKIGWHRTPQTAWLMDLSYDPLDYSSIFESYEKVIREWKVTPYCGLEFIVEKASRVARMTASHCEKFFSSIQSIKDLPNAFESKRKRKAVRFNFDNYVQHHLAYAFTLARLGQTKEAYKWLEIYLEEGKIKEVFGSGLSKLMNDQIKNTV